jgi:hypothetical protein
VRFVNTRAPAGRSDTIRAVATEIPCFDELVDLLRIRLRDADAVNPHESHSFKELMRDHADVIADQWYHQAFDELDADAHLDRPASGKAMGDAHGRLSADGRLFLRQSES